jgi:ABC-2 type transport system permease protein
VTIVSRCFDTALDRAIANRSSGRRHASPASGGFSGLAFFYLPLPLRLIAAKDLRTFFRDPLQWSQLAILFGLLALYLTNMPTLRAQLSGWGWYLIIPFLNLCAVGLILATFTCRFVFPLVSLEGRKLWLIGLLPVPRGHVLYAKLAFAMTVTLLVALSTMGLAIIILRLPAIWAAIHLVVTVAMCYGLCGLSVGIGARLPMFGETNAARIANGFGGTANLLASIVLVTLMLVAVGYATWLCRHMAEDAMPGGLPLALCATAVVLGMVAGSLAMRVGRGHFSQIET